MPANEHRGEAGGHESVSNETDSMSEMRSPPTRRRARRPPARWTRFRSAVLRIPPEFIRTPDLIRQPAVRIAWLAHETGRPARRWR